MSKQQETLSFSTTEIQSVSTVLDNQSRMKMAASTQHPKACCCCVSPQDISSK